MWPFDGEPKAPMHQPGERMMTMEEALMHRLLYAEQRIESLEKSVVMLANAYRQMADSQNHNFASLGERFMQLVQYVMRPRVSIVPGEQPPDKN